MHASKTCTATFATTTPDFVQITSPAPDTVINFASVLVQGTVNVPIGLEVGVTINGVLAAVHGGTFAAMVPVASDTTSLTAEATTAIGTTDSHSITVSVSTTQGPSVTLEASPKNGVAPLITQFVVHSDFVPLNIELDIDSDGTVEYNGPQVENHRFFLTQAKFYVATARVTDPIGTMFTVKTVVQIYDQDELDARLQAKWSGMKDALRNADINGAMNFIVTASQAKYQEAFQIIATQLPDIDQILTDISAISTGNRTAVYEATRIDDAVETSFEVRFAIDRDGIWRLDSF
jgi:hypothetical protein